MANYSFSFNRINRSFLNTELWDGTKLQVKMPKKSTFEKLTTLQQYKDDKNATIEDVMDTFGSVVAEVLSNNLDGRKFTAKEVTDNMDIEEMKDFLFSYYRDFVGTLADDPN